MQPAVDRLNLRRLIIGIHDDFRITSLLLNIAHAIDHLMLLVFATAVATIAREFGIGRWEDLMPYTTGAFVMFGIGSPTQS
jgi:hypothetical protein